MNDPDSTTRTDSRNDDSGAAVVSIWKLRVLYSAGAIMKRAVAPKGWTGDAPLTLGRAANAQTSGSTLALADERVSREHAQLFSEGTHAFLRDLGSKNGTTVNGHRLLASDAWRLSDGDLIEVGDSLILARYEPAIIHDMPIAEVIGVSAVACQLRCSLAQCATSDRPVLLLGDTGTGKGVAAHAIHARSERRGKLVTVNCAGIPASLADGLFFGVERGAYTGAVEHAGFFGEADRGTLLLDEVGDLPREIQPKLLLALESKQVTPLGRTTPVRRDVRVLAATNRDLSAAMASGSFREDLYARLSAQVVSLPPLRQRREDILLLAQYLAERPLKLSPRLASAMLRYEWPRNVREVGNVIGQYLSGDEAAVLGMLSAPLSRGPSKGDVPQGVAAPSSLPPSSVTQPRLWHAGDPVPSAEDVNRLLRGHAGSLHRIERLYGYPRRQFRRWIERYGIDLSEFRQPE